MENNALKQNEIYTARIESVSSDGRGVSRINGMAVFVPFTADGDVARIRITAVKKRYAEGRIDKILSPSPNRTDPLCPHYGTCGGCNMRHISYEHQLEIKRMTVENAMRRIGGFKDFHIDEMIGMDDPSHYRNKMTFPSGDAEGEAMLGMYEMRSRNITASDGCLIGARENDEICSAVLEYMRENGIKTVKHSRTDTALTGVSIRKSHYSGEISVSVLKDGKTLPNIASLVSKLRALSADISGITVTDGKKTVLLYGGSVIHENIMGVSFEVSPGSFFQINPMQTEKLYAKALSYADITKNTDVMDIYCGIGSISLCAAGYAKKVIGIEIVEDAVKDAKKNAELNGIDNASFYAGDAAKLVPEIIKNGERPNVVILDPPRSGSDKKTLAAIASAAPNRIVYISCDSATLARDTKYLSTQGYQIKTSAAIDMFPHTNHVETIMLLQRQDT